MVKYLPNGEIVFKGIRYPPIGSISDRTFDKERWFEHWEKITEEIKTLKLDYSQIRDMHDAYVSDIISYGSLKELVTEHCRVIQAGTRLKLAFHMAYSNYRDSRTGLVNFLIGLFASKLIDKLDFPKLQLQNKK